MLERWLYFSRLPPIGRHFLAAALDNETRRPACSRDFPRAVKMPIIWWRPGITLYASWVPAQALALMTTIIAVSMGRCFVLKRNQLLLCVRRAPLASCCLTHPTVLGAASASIHYGPHCIGELCGWR